MNSVVESVNMYTKDLSLLGILNIVIYVISMFLLLPIIDKYANIKISLFNYGIWYVFSILETLYLIYLIYTYAIKKKQSKNVDADDTVDKHKLPRVVYRWFTSGGLKSYQDMFLITEIEPLYEYILLFMILLIPIANNYTMKQKIVGIFAKIGIFHMISSVVLMDWSELTVDYAFRDIDHEVLVA